MNKTIRTSSVLLSSLLLLNLCLAQVEHPSDYQQELIVKKIRASLNSTSEVSDLFICDNARSNKTVPGEGHYTFIDPRNTLKNCIIFIYTRTDSSSPNELDAKVEAGFGILKDDSVIWSSGFLLKNYPVLGAHIIGVADLNNDGQLEIMATNQYGAQAEREKLYLVSIMAKGAGLLNPMDSDGESTIIGGFDTFKFVDRNHRGVLEIETIDPDSDKQIAYSWDGKLYNASKSKAWK